MIKISNINMSFGKRKILNNVNLEIKKRTITTITGKSGTGKTTLLGIISGLLKPDSGEVLFNGKNILKWGDFKRSRYRNKEIGFVFQFFNLLQDLTAYENIMYPAAVKLFSKVTKSDVEYLINYLDIKKIIHQYPQSLSGGERQRVAVARAIINKPQIILADEPTGNLDDETANSIIKLFIELKEKHNIAIIIVTHDKRFVKIADKNYHLVENELILKKSQKKLKKRVISKKTVKI